MTRRIVFFEPATAKPSWVSICPSRLVSRRKNSNLALCNFRTIPAFFFKKVHNNLPQFCGTYLELTLPIWAQLFRKAYTETGLVELCFYFFRHVENTLTSFRLRWLLYRRMMLAIQWRFKNSMVLNEIWHNIIWHDLTPSKSQTTVFGGLSSSHFSLMLNETTILKKVK